MDKYFFGQNKTSFIRSPWIMRKLGFLFMFGMISLVSGVLPAIAGDEKQANEQTVLRATLKNGLRVVIVKNSLAPVVTTEINYLVGSDETPAGLSGDCTRARTHDVPRKP